MSLTISGSSRTLVAARSAILSQLKSQKSPTIWIKRGFSIETSRLYLKQNNTISLSNLLPQKTYGTQIRLFATNEKGNKTASAEEEEEDEELVVTDISKYRVSPETIQILKEKGITKFFPIQYETYDLIYDGSDIVGRARTGTGKTLSFALPVLEKLKSQNRPRTRGRSTQVLVMAPTRELAKQVASEFEIVAPNLNVATIYGGTPIYEQEQQFREGVDVVVGTPGRIKDLLQRGSLKFDSVDYVILDEADEMLKIGFQEDMEEILAQIPKSKKKQTMLFSATIPPWVAKIARTYLNPDYKTVDLVGDEKIKSSELIKHYVITTSKQNRDAILADVINVYSKGGNTLIFAGTKSEANNIAQRSSISSMCQVLHGDIPQAQREVTLEAFKKKHFSVLVATDVAARGIDIPHIELVVQTEPPKVPETYMHRVGRTARAGKEGTAVMFTSDNPMSRMLLKQIEREVGIQMKPIGAPQVSDILKASEGKVQSALDAITPETVAHFTELAKKIIDQKGAVSALAAALAKLSGYSEHLATRSLVLGLPGFQTVRLFPKYDLNFAKATRLFSDFSFMAKGVKLCTDGSAIADIPTADAKKMIESNAALETSKNPSIVKFEIATQLPELIPDTSSAYDLRGRDTGPRGYAGRREYGDRDRYKSKSGYGESRSYGDRDRKYGDRDRSYGDRDRSYGGSRSSYGDRDRGYGGDKNRDYKPKNSGYGGRSFGEKLDFDPEKLKF